MKYLFVTLMWNARAEMPGPGDIFAVCCQSYSPNGMTRYGRYTHLDDMLELLSERHSTASCVNVIYSAYILSYCASARKRHRIND